MHHPRPIVVHEEPHVVIVALSSRLFLRVVLVEGVTIGRWFLDEEPTGEVVLAQEI